MGRLLCSGSLSQRVSARFYKGERAPSTDHWRYRVLIWVSMVSSADQLAEGELVDLIDEFSEGRIQFAFCKVKDPNTGLPKSVLIAWVCQEKDITRSIADHVVVW